MPSSAERHYDIVYGGRRRRGIVRRLLRRLLNWI
jgi:hypothetical protein